MRLAAIDIGSNSIKLVVAEAAGDSFAVLAREKEVVRLGHDTLRLGFLSADAISLAADTLRRFRTAAEALGAGRVIAIATAAVREARNADEFIAEAGRRAGLDVGILTGIEEARLVGIAAAHGCAGSPGLPLVNVDIGGGSTEVSLMRGGEALGLFSVKLGAVGLTEKHLLSDPPRAKELRALREEVRDGFEGPARELRGAGWQRATGTSGTAIAVGDVLRRQGAAAGAGRGAPQAGVEIAFGRLGRLNERLAGMTTAERRAVPGISAQRAEIVVAGGQVLEGAMRALSINMLRSCDFALREGVIIDHLRRGRD